MSILRSLIGLIVCLIAAKAAAAYNCAGPGHCHALFLYGNNAFGCGPRTDDDCLQGFGTVVDIVHSDYGDEFTTHEMWLYAEDTSAWIEVGYGSFSFFPGAGVPPEGSHSGDAYFWAHQEPVTYDFMSYYIGPVLKTDVGQEAALLISHYPDPNGRDPRQFRIGLSVGMGNSGNPRTWTTNIDSDIFATTKHGHIEVGQELFGTAGAYSPVAVFRGNAWIDTLYQAHTIDQEGGVENNNPPYGSWVDDPNDLSHGGPPGGTFITLCCQALAGPPGASSGRPVRNPAILLSTRTAGAVVGL